MFRPVALKPLPNHRLWLRYSDGTEGEVDLSDLVGRGVFVVWNDPETFERARIGPHGEVKWGEGIDLCPDALYLRLTGKRPEEVFPNLRAVP